MNMIQRVRGNQIVMVVDLQKVIVRNEVGLEKKGLELDAGDKISLRLVNRSGIYIYTPVWVPGDTKIIATDNGRLMPGKYAIEVVIKTVDGVRYRAMHRDVIKIVETNNDTDYYTDDAEIVQVTENIEAQILTDGSTIIINKSGISEDRVREIIEEEGIPEKLDSLREDVDQNREDISERVKSDVTWRREGETEYVISRTNLASGENNSVGLTWDGDGFNFYTGENSRKPTIDGEIITTDDKLKAATEGKADKETIPTKVSELENDAVYLATVDIASEKEIMNLFDNK